MNALVRWVTPSSRANLSQRRAGCPAATQFALALTAVLPAAALAEEGLATPSLPFAAHRPWQFVTRGSQGVAAEIKTREVEVHLGHASTDKAEMHFEEPRARPNLIRRQAKAPSKSDDIVDQDPFVHVSAGIPAPKFAVVNETFRAADLSLLVGRSVHRASFTSMNATETTPAVAAAFLQQLPGRSEHGATVTPSLAVMRARGKLGVDDRPVRTLVINLDTRVDRWQRIAARVERFNQSGQLLVERLQATDARVDLVPVDSVRLEWSTDRNAEFVKFGLFYGGSTLTLTASERGCAMSHVRAWRSVAAGANMRGDDQPTLILEDDAVLVPHFASLLRAALATVRASVADGADVLYVGYSVGAPLRREVGAGIFEAEYLWSTIGYILWPRGAKALLRALPVDQPVDNFLAWQARSGKLRAYAVAPQLVEPEFPWDVHSDVDHSDENAGFVLRRLGKLLLAPWQLVFRGVNFTSGQQTVGAQQPVGSEQPVVVAQEPVGAQQLLAVQQPAGSEQPLGARSLLGPSQMPGPQQPHFPPDVRVGARLRQQWRSSSGERPS